MDRRAVARAVSAPTGGAAARRRSTDGGRAPHDTRRAGGGPRVNRDGGGGAGDIRISGRSVLVTGTLSPALSSLRHPGAARLIRPLGEPTSSPGRESAIEHQRLSTVQRTSRRLFRACLRKTVFADILGRRQVNVVREKLSEWIGWALRTRLSRSEGGGHPQLPPRCSHVATGLNNGRIGGTERHHRGHASRRRRRSLRWWRCGASEPRSVPAPRGHRIGAKPVCEPPRKRLHPVSLVGQT
jgi:hypothetical protein